MSVKQQVQQNQQSVSLFRDTFLQRVVKNPNISKKEYQVLMILLTELEGYASWERLMSPREPHDPRNFRKISPSAIADTIQMSKKDVKKAIDGLIEKGLVEKGSSATCKDAYRFTF